MTGALTPAPSAPATPSAPSPWKARLRYVLALFFCGMGVLHFVRVDDFVSVMPAWLPWHRELVWISGIAELCGGLGLLHPKTRPWAAWGLVALLVAVFPANVNMALHEIPMGGGDPPPRWAMWLRLPFQLPLIAWAWWYTRPDPPARARSSRQA